MEDFTSQASDVLLCSVVSEQRKQDCLTHTSLPIGVSAPPTSRVQAFSVSSPTGLEVLEGHPGNWVGTRSRLSVHLHTEHQKLSRQRQVAAVRTDGVPVPLTRAGGSTV